MKNYNENFLECQIFIAAVSCIKLSKKKSASFEGVSRRLTAFHQNVDKNHQKISPCQFKFPTISITKNCISALLTCSSCNFVIIQKEGGNFISNFLSAFSTKWRSMKGKKFLFRVQVGKIEKSCSQQNV